jgi:septal ring factor EnvC (AmiA/AmiB activator)
LAGTVLGGLALKRLSTYGIAFDKYRREVQQQRTHLANLGSAVRDTSGSCFRLTEKLNRLEEKLLDVGNQLATTRSSLAAAQREQPSPTRVDPYSTSLNAPQQPSYSIFNPDPLIPASYATKSQPQPPTSAFSDLNRPPNPQSSAQKQTQVTAAFNSGDRQTIRTETTALLNITTESENAIAMGQSVNTELQVESAGGSYCLVQISGESWLYPSEQTLRSFSQYQPAKGVFEFIRQAVHSPQILSPALIVKSGSVWRVEQTGQIAVPG